MNVKKKKTEKNDVCNNREKFDVFNAIMMLSTLVCKKNSLDEIMSDWNIVFCLKIIKVQSDFYILLICEVIRTENMLIFHSPFHSVLGKCKIKTESYFYGKT
jgi:hypothetical protein